MTDFIEPKVNLYWTLMIVYIPFIVNESSWWIIAKYSGTVMVSKKREPRQYLVTSALKKEQAIIILLDSWERNTKTEKVVSDLTATESNSNKGIHTDCKTGFNIQGWNSCGSI